MCHFFYSTVKNVGHVIRKEILYIFLAINNPEGYFSHFLFSKFKKSKF